VSAATAAGLAVIVRLADREHRSVLELGPETRHRDRKVRRCHHQVNARDLFGRPRVDGHDPSAGAVESHELDVEDVGHPDVGDVQLLARDPSVSADPSRRGSDPAAHQSGASAVARMADVICL
jgi:hypothetical protein